MNRILYIYIFVFVFFAAKLNGQELRPTQFNEALLKKEVIKQRTNLKRLKSTNAIPYVDLPFFDDFSYSQKQTYPSPKLWADDNVFVNSSYADSVISIGVATLDAADKYGDIYAVDNSVTPSDTLTSNYIRLGNYMSKPVFLSFFWQAGGKGEVPDQSDTLFLEFYDSIGAVWDSIWFVTGNSSDDSVKLNTHIFTQQVIKIEDKYKTDNFRFRFRNYTTLSPKSVLGREGALSNMDYWHLDYIQIKQTADADNMANLNDIMFTEPLQSSLVEYTAVPWEHYGITNRFKTTNKSPVSFRVYYPNENPSDKISVNRRHQILGFNNQILEEGTGLDANEDPFSYAVYKEDFINNDIAEDNDGKVVFRSFLEANNLPGNQLVNDTLYRTEEFDSCYAYDDGVPELGFGVSGEGAYLAQIAIKFSPYVNDYSIDTLTGLQIYFNKTRGSANTGKDYEFRLAVWGYGSSGKPGALIHANDEYNTEQPDFESSEGNDFQYYKFDSLLLIRDTVIFVGIIQETSNFLNIGYDVNNDKRHKLYINTSNSWYKVDSTLQRPGTVMIRPVFGKYIVPAEEKAAGKNKQLVITPNPAQQNITLKLADDKNNEISLSEKWQYSIYDCTGKLLLKNTYAYSDIDISFLNKGIYFVHILNLNSHVAFQNKLIKIE